MITYHILKTQPLGDLLLTANDTHLTGIYFADCPHAPDIPAAWVKDAHHAVLDQACGQVQEYLSGTRTLFSLPLQGAGTELQQRIWREIARIPFGETLTYTELAARAGFPRAVRAAGTATGRNPLSIVVPCHRVIGKNGAMRGYAGGLDRKKHLLGLEGTRGWFPEE